MRNIHGHFFENVHGLFLRFAGKKKTLDNFKHPADGELQLFTVCVCVCFPQICYSVDESQWVTSDVEWVSCCFFLWSPQVLLLMRESENVTFFFLWELHLRCFSIRIIVYAVFPRSMTLRPENEWPSLSEKKGKWSQFWTQRSRLSAALRCVCVSYIYVTQSKIHSEWVTRFPIFNGQHDDIVCNKKCLEWS